MSSTAQSARIGRLLRLLVDENIVDGRAALEGRVSVTDLSRSNAVGLVQVDSRPVAVVKAGAVSVDDVDPVAGEAAAYRWLAAAPATSRLAPSLVAGWTGEGAIVTQPVADARTLHEALAAATQAGAEALIAELGWMLGCLHAARVGCADLPARRPWILGVPAGRVPAMYAGDAAVERVLATIAAHPAIAAAISVLDRTWSAHTAVHGDVKFDNVLVVGAADRPRVMLVDWELAGRGEPAWDLAGVVDGLVLPHRLADDRGPVVDRAWISRLAGPALAAHRAAAGRALGPSDDELATAVVARLAQTAVQLTAMGAAHPAAADGAPRLLAAAGELADDLADVLASASSRVAPCTP